MFQTIQNNYTIFLNRFPEILHPFISLVLAILIIFAVFKVLKKNFVFLILLVVLLPASVPILKSLGQGILNLVKFIATSF